MNDGSTKLKPRGLLEKENAALFARLPAALWAAKFSIAELWFAFSIIHADLWFAHVCECFYPCQFCLNCLFIKSKLGIGLACPHALMPKRGSSTSESNVVQKALRVAGASERACFQLLQLGQESKDKGAIPNSLTRWKAAVTKALPTDLIVQVPVGSVSNDSQIYIPVTNLPVFIQRRALKNPVFATHLQRAMLDKQFGPLSLLLYFDEAQAGNILSCDLTKKLLSGYVAIAELGLLHLETSWMDLCAFSHNSVHDVTGGWSKVFKEVVLALDNFGMEAGFPCSVPGSEPFWLRLKITCVTGDLDFLRCFYDWKGSGSIKMCLVCKNVVSQSSGLAAYDSSLVDVAEPDFTKSAPWSNEELEQVWDKPATNPAMTIKAQKHEEKAAGFNIYNREGLLADNRSRRLTPVTSVFFDTMHGYYSNGLVSWEVVLFMECLKPLGITPEVIGQAFCQTDWQNGTTKGSKHWYKTLVSPQRFTRGCASDLRALLPLLFFHVSEIPGLNEVQQELLSLESLVKVTKVLYQIQALGKGTADLVAELARAQHGHHVRFCAAYGKEALKPKHHCVRHLPKQIQTHGLYADCFAMEAKHRVFKYGIQNRVDSELKNKHVYAEKVLTRLLLHTDEAFDKSPCLGDLLPPLSNCTLFGLCGKRGAGIQLKHGCIRSNDFIVTDLGSGVVGACMEIPGHGLVLLMDLYQVAPRLLYVPLCRGSGRAAPWAARLHAFFFRTAAHWAAHFWLRPCMHGRRHLR